MKRLKKTSTVFLSILMVVTLFLATAFTAFAEDDQENTETSVVTAQDEPSSHEHNGVIFTEWTDALAAAQHIDNPPEGGWTASNSIPVKEGSYYLSSDVTSNIDSWHNNETIKLCLNEHDISMVKLLSYVNSGNLTLYDHPLSHAQFYTGYGFDVNTGSSFTLNSAKIANVDASENHDWVVNNGGTLTVHHGEITASDSTKKGINNSGTLNLSGNVVINGSNQDFVGIYANDSGTINITGELTCVSGSISVASQTEPSVSGPVTIAQGVNYSIESGDVAKFVSKNPEYNIRMRDNTIQLTLPSVTFDSNGGTGSMNEQYVPKNDPTALASNTFSYDGYVFDGWNTEADGSGQSFTDREEVTLDSDLTLYAQWATVPGLDLGDGSVSVSDGSIIYIPADHTLTLFHGAEISGGIRYTGSDMLTIEVKDNVPVDGGLIVGNNSYGIYAKNADVTIQGYGTLNVIDTLQNVPDTTTMNSYGIYTRKGIEFKGDVVVNASGAGGVNESRGIYASDISFNDQVNVHASGGNNTIEGSYGIDCNHITMLGGIVSGTAGDSEANKSYGINVDGEDATLTIHDGTITGDAGNVGINLKADPASMDGAIKATAGSSSSDCQEVGATATNLKSYPWSNLEIVRAKGGYTIALEDSIDIYYQVYGLTEGTRPEDYEITYTFDGKTETKNLTQADITGNNSYSFIIAKCAARQMTDPVNYTIKYIGGGIEQTLKTGSKSIKQYCDETIESPTGTYPEKEVSICKAILDYGTYAQKYFKYKTDTLANGGTDYYNPNDISLPEYTSTVTGSCTGITGWGSSLVTKSKTGFNIVFEHENGTTFDNYEFTVDGETVTATEVDDSNFYIIKISGIAAKDLDNEYTVTVINKSDVSTMTYKTSPLRYLATAGGSSEENICKMLYNYHLKAKEYFTQ